MDEKMKKIEVKLQQLEDSLTELSDKKKKHNDNYDEMLLELNDPKAFQDYNSRIERLKRDQVEFLLNCCTETFGMSAKGFRKYLRPFKKLTLPIIAIDNPVIIYVITVLKYYLIKQY